ncbi:MAG: hypothetical protein ACI8UO_002611, partial [Verrucomicrobiales bacterium]
PDFNWILLFSPGHSTAASRQTRQIAGRAHCQEFGHLRNENCGSAGLLQVPEITVGKRACFRQFMTFRAPLIFVFSLSLCASAFSAPPKPESAPNWWDEAGEIPDADESVSKVIDQAISARLEELGAEPAPAAAEETQFRRLTLDLVGRIPTLAELDAFRADSSPDRWEKTVDRLLASPSFARHQAHEFNWLLRDGKSGDFRNYLMAATAEDRRWDQIFEEVILARHSEEKKGVDEFIRDNLRDLDRLTAKVSVRFFGVDVSCAQCHDHPYVADWTQATYYGMQSFFNRSFDNGGYVAEREYGLVSFKTTKGEEHKASLTFLGGPAIEEPAELELDEAAKKAEKERFEQLKKDKKQAPAPKYSRRGVLVKEALDDQGYFARALANQVWNRHFGRGLVMPLDQMHGQNLPSHPELLLWIENDLRTHQFDLRRLIKGIVMSEAWRRSSVWEGEGTRPAAELFAVSEPRPLTPRQFGISVHVAMADPNQFSPEASAEEIGKRIEQMERSGEGIANRFDRPKDNFHFAVEEALYFSNSADAIGRIQNGGLLRALNSIENRDERIQLAIRSVYSREAEAEEIEILTKYLAEREDRAESGLQQLLWALLTSNEARFNH